ncbi:alanine racemase [Alteromonas oceanisediminis]|uniref:alanine racemase n=1 Tax=Alteromonas oceanisediminis TaxID=2836180 RepID=UPI001BDA3860|nr:alanine racemase [Alteromonas oceanisediminis]MBT0585940.1 alanine racemase [Alteromonas oceanisediminis]
MTRKTYAHIDLAAVQHNFDQLSACAPNSQHVAVIKANAYGHGAIAVAEALASRVALFAVAFMDEAKQLREAGIDTPILSLEGFFDEEEAIWAANHNVWLVIHHLAQLERVERLQNPPIIWFKIDTGMHRLGFSLEEAPGLLQRFSHLLGPDSAVFTHLACADEVSNDKTRQQLDNLSRALSTQQTHLALSVANSAATVHWPSAHQRWNRLGIGLYGGFTGGSPELPQPKLLPAMSLHAPVIALRDLPAGETVGYGSTWRAQRNTRLATVAIGYADGYPRHAPSGTPAICHGQRIYLAGRVSMDMLIFDVTDCPQVALGDEVELWGSALSIKEVADHSGTIDYELMTRVSERVPRVVKRI